MKKKLNIIIFGAGAVGASVGGWIASEYNNIFFYDKGDVADILRTKGITHYLGEEQNKAQRVKVNVINDLRDVPSPDIIVVAVKNYSLDAVSKFIKDTLGDTPIIVALQNGVENQTILPNYFSRVIYGVVCYNAWLDSPGVVGYQKRGPIVLGTINNQYQSEMKAVAQIFNKGVETMITPHLHDASHSKMIVNLTNSLTTLIGHTYKEISDPGIFQKLLTNLTYEGSKIVKAAGYKECKLGGMPSWFLMKTAATLPQFITRRLFEKNVKKMVISSMAQDIIQRGGTESELESINGYFLKMADSNGVKAPYNRTIYQMCVNEFNKPSFKPLDVKDVWKEVEKVL
ncbi:MAG: 2-dehydropantoate 2-reductase [Desulfobacteraceae bacterium]|nr:2-dehydropantoate 2-reductase [Desulfobacteraceae bacterium]